MQLFFRFITKNSFKLSSFQKPLRFKGVKLENYGNFFKFGPPVQVTIVALFYTRSKKH